MLTEDIPVPASLEDLLAKWITLWEPVIHGECASAFLISLQKNVLAA